MAQTSSIWSIDAEMSSLKSPSRSLSHMIDMMLYSRLCSSHGNSGSPLRRFGGRGSSGSTALSSSSSAASMAAALGSSSTSSSPAKNASSDDTTGPSRFFFRDTRRTTFFSFSGFGGLIFFANFSCHIARILAHSAATSAPSGSVPAATTSFTLRGFIGANVGVSVGWIKEILPSLSSCSGVVWVWVCQRR